jgi:hypothetical protein
MGWREGSISTDLGTPGWRLQPPRRCRRTPPTSPTRSATPSPSCCPPHLLEELEHYTDVVLVPTTRRTGLRA